MGVGRLPLKIQLDLSRHCIETEIKRLYNRSVVHYFNSRNNKQKLEIRIDVLKNALEQLDFSFLRSHYPILSGGIEKDVFLAVDPDGEMHIITPEEIVRL